MVRNSFRNRGCLVKAMGALGAEDRVSKLASFAEAVGALATYGYGMRSEAENKPRVKAEALTRG